MEFKKRHYRKKILIFFLLAMNNFHWVKAGESFKLYENKRPNSTLRYQTSDGYISYYQRNTGELMLSTKLEVHSLLNSGLNEHFFLSDSSFGEKIIISSSQNFYTTSAFVPMNELYYSVIGEKTVGKIADLGFAPRLHLKDTWVSYYQHKFKIVKFHSFTNQELNFQVKLNKNTQYLHIPTTLMLDSNTVLFNDINNQRKFALMKLERSTQTIVPIYLTNLNEEMNLCQQENTIFMMMTSSSGTKLYKMDFLGNNQFSNPKEIYSSNFPEHPQFICDSENALGVIYFLKDISMLGSKEYRPYKLDVIKKELVEIPIKSNGLVSIDSMFRMGKSLFVSSGEKYYVLDKN